MKPLAIASLLIALLTPFIYAQSIYLSVDGPSGYVKPGDSFQLTYTLTWDEGFFTEDYRFIGISVANMQWPDYLGRIVQQINVDSNLPEAFEVYAGNGYMNQGETGFSLHDFAMGGGTLTPPVLVATVTFQTYAHTPERSYLMPLNFDWTKTYYATSDYNMHAFDPENVKIYTLNVSSVPEPSTYAAGIGIIALAAAAYARRKRS